MANRPDPRLLVMVDAQSQARATVADRVIAALILLWQRFDGWARPDLIAEVAEAAWVNVAAGQAASAAVADSYMSQMVSFMRDEVVDPVGVDDAMRESLRRGVTGPQIQERVASEMRWQTWRGVDVDAAFDTAMARMREQVTTDLALANQQQSAKFMRRRGTRLWQRVTRGEGTCGLCAAAANRLYTREDLLPIHARCRCSVLEVGSVLGGGRSLTDADYKALTGVTRGLDAKNLKDVRYVVDEHGELGPVLRNRTQRISTVDAAGKVKSKTASKPAAQKRLAVDHGLSAMGSVADVDRAEQIARKSLAWAQRQDLRAQIEFHQGRLDALAARRAVLVGA